MAAVTVGTLVLLLVGCGRSGLGRRDAGAGDAKPDIGAWLPDTPDVATPSPDLAVQQPDADPFSCALLRPLVDKGVLIHRHVKQVLFAPDGRSFLLLANGDDGGNSDEALLVSPPGGEQRTLATDARDAQWLGKDRVLVTTSAESALRVVSLTGDVLQTVATKTCSHVGAPDGSRVYYTHDCDFSSGAVSVIDVGTGATQQLAARISISSLVVSPGSQWAAYVAYTGPADASTSTTAVYVVDKGGTPYAVAIPSSAWDPVFLSDEILLLESSPSSGYLDSTIWRHRLGTGDANSLLAEGDHGFVGYEWNADRSAFLLAKFAASSPRTSIQTAASFPSTATWAKRERG